MDLDSNDFIASSHINSTYGKSNYCAGLEYRSAIKGYFKFQNLVHHTGGFVTSFTKLNADVEISNCNIVDVEITTKPDLPAVLYVILHKVTISEFIIFNVKYTEGKFSLLSVEKNGDIQNTLQNSYIDVDSSVLGERLTTVDVKVLKPDDHEGVTTRLIYQLNYRDCIGAVAVTPPQIGETLKVDDEYVEVETSDHQQENPDAKPDDPEQVIPPKSENQDEPAKSDNNSEQEGPGQSHEHIFESIEVGFSNITDDDLEKNENDKGGSKSKAGLIAGVTVSSVAVVGGSVAGVAYYLVKKKTPVAGGGEGHGGNKEENQP